MSQTLALSLRPASLDSFIGNASVTASIKKQLAERVPNAILLTGAPGTGKTSLSKIIARMVNPGVDESELDITEVNGSAENGIDSIRELIHGSGYRPLTGQRKVFIVNEAQGLTSASKQALLDPLESNNESALWIFTSMSDKMDKDEKLDKAFRRRCVHYALKLMTEPEIKALVQRAAENSSLDYDTTTFLTHILNAKVGSPGEIIAAWEKYSSGTPLAECLVDSAHQAEYRDIAYAVCNGNWNKTRALLANIPTADSRALRTIVAGLLRSELLRTEVGTKGAAIATCLVGLGNASFEDGVAYSTAVGLLFKTCVAISAGAK